MNSKNFTALAPTFGSILITSLGTENKVNQCLTKSELFYRTHAPHREGRHPAAPDVRELSSCTPTLLITSHLTSPSGGKESLVLTVSTQSPKTSFRVPWGTPMPFRPRDQASTPLPFFTLWRGVWWFRGGKCRWERCLPGHECQGYSEALPVMAPGDSRGHPPLCPSYLWLSVPRDPLNLPNTKKLKDWSSVGFFLVPGCIPWVLGVAPCFLHI